nr:G protein-coupled receptor [Proales similis]
MAGLEYEADCEADQYCQNTINAFLGLNFGPDLLGSSGQGGSHSVSSNLSPICDCVTKIYSCWVERTHEQYGLKWPTLEQVYFWMYILGIILATCVNLLLLVVLGRHHRNLAIMCVLKKIFAASQTTPRAKRARNNNTQQIASLNSLTDLLFLSLILGHAVIIVFILPYQIYLFSTGRAIQDCKTSEFFKAFGVTQSIYSLVALSIHRLIAIKTQQLSYIQFGDCFVVDSFRILLLPAIFCRALFAFLFSKTYRRHLITFMLIAITTGISVTIGLLNSSNYGPIEIELSGLEFFLQNASCIFPPNLRPKITYCGLLDYPKEERNRNTIIYTVSLLVLPNVLVIGSYGLVCHHIWSSSQKLDIGWLRAMRRNQNSPDQVELREGDHEKAKDTGSASEETSSVSNQASNSSSPRVPSLETVMNQNIENYNQFWLKKRNMNVTLTTCLMVAGFTLCWTPFFLLPLFYEKFRWQTQFNRVKVPIQLLGYLSSFFNPIILMISSKRYLNEIRRLFPFLGSVSEPYQPETRIRRRGQNNAETGVANL